MVMVMWIGLQAWRWMLDHPNPCRTRKITRLKASLKSGLGAGRYKARWSIKAADGHEQSGSFSFRLR